MVLLFLISGCGSETGPSGPVTDPFPERPPELELTVTVPGEVPPDFEAPFLWAPLSFADAVDLGHVPERVPEVAQRPGGPVQLVEVGEEAGLGQAGSAGNSHGVGVGWFDVDGDGWEDIVLANGIRGGEASPSRLFRNQGDGTFVDDSERSGLGPILAGLDTYSVAAADIDADGDLDVHITAHPHDVLLRNRGDGTFEDGTAAAGMGGPASVRDGSGSSKIGAFGHLDDDGYVDLVVASSTFADEPANGYVLRNRGDGTFEDVTAPSRFAAAPTGNPCAVLWSDSDNDGDQDLWIWNDRGDRQANRVLLINDGARFSDRTVSAGLTNPVGNPMGIDAADIDDNGILDYYIGNIGTHPLFLGQPGGTWVDGSIAAGTQGEYGWGLGFEDLNADGYFDLFVAQEDDRPYFTFTHDGQWPPSFTRQDWGHAPVGNGHNVAVAFADYDHDHDVDILTAPTSGAPMSLLRNDTDRGTQRFVEVRVAARPGTGATGGVGGRVVVKTGDRVVFKDISAGSSRASQHAMSIRVGLGQWTGAAWVGVLWPDGAQVTAVNVPGDSVITL